MHRETLVEGAYNRDLDNANAAPGDVAVQRTKPRTRDQKGTAKSNAIISSISTKENEALLVELTQDLARAPTLEGCLMKGAGGCEEGLPSIDSMAGKAAQDASSDAKDTVNGPNEAASNDEILAPEAVCLSTPRRNTHCRMRPSRGVQPIKSQTFALSVVVEASSDPQSVLTRATTLTMSESPSSASDSLPCPKSRKRVVVVVVEEEEEEEESESIAKKARKYDKGMSPVLQGS